MTPDFDAMRRAAFPPGNTPPVDRAAFDDLYTVLFLLIRWHIPLATASTRDRPTPYVVNADGAVTMFVFTDSERYVRWANSRAIVRGERIALAMPDGMPWLQSWHPRVTRVRFNDGPGGWNSPLAPLAGLADDLRLRGRLPAM